MRSAFAVASFLLAVLSTAGSAATLALDAAHAHRLDTLRPGESMDIDAFPDGYGGTAHLHFRRIEVYAPGARIVLAGPGGYSELPRSPRRHLVGSDASGRVRASLSFDARLHGLAGAGVSPAGSFVLTAERTPAGALRLHAAPSEAALPPGVVPRILSGDDALPSGRAAPDALAIALGGSAPAGSPRVATVAVDTDNEFMSLRFGNDAAAATGWIADLFAAMNVMYLRDLNVELRQGTTYLRTSPDPYTVTTTPAAQANLAEFGTYWQDNYGDVPRSFATLLSGKAVSGTSASGIAWVNAYCQTQSAGGGYSVNQVFTDAQIPIGYSALIVGHELGHNFGAYHTHCTDASSGAAPAAGNTIDRCYSGEAGCYSGATSCPASGPGAPAGTVMSYCNLRGCGSNGQNVLQFHPAQVATLSALVAQNTPSCLASDADEIFADGFD